MLLKIEVAANGLIVTEPTGGVHVLNGHAEIPDELERARLVAQELGELVLGLAASPQPEATTTPSPDLGPRARERQVQDEELREEGFSPGNSLEDAIEDTISRHGAKLAGDFLGFLRKASYHSKDA